MRIGLVRPILQGAARIPSCSRRQYHPRKGKYPLTADVQHGLVIPNSFKLFINRTREIKNISSTTSNLINTTTFTNSRTSYHTSTMPLQPGDKFPSDVKFIYIPYTKDKAEITACGTRQNLNASEEWAQKKVVLFAVPGAFTPGCQNTHLPGFIRNHENLKKKGVDIIAVIAADSAHVMAAWGKANNIRNNEILFLSDEGAKFSKSIGWNNGDKALRYAIVIDKGVVLYAGRDEPGKVENSSADTVLAKL